MAKVPYTLIDFMLGAFGRLCDMFGLFEYGHLANSGIPVWLVMMSLSEGCFITEGIWITVDMFTFIFSFN